MDKPAILHRVSTTARAVALTFGDGPNPVYTPQLLTSSGRRAARPRSL